MVPREKLSESELFRSLAADLREIPGTVVPDHAHEETGDRLIDGFVDVEIRGERIRLVIQVKSTAYPRDVREAVWQLRSYMSQFEGPRVETVPVVVAGTISPGGRAHLRDQGVGYYDASGSLYLPARHAYIFVEKPASKSAKRTLDSFFRGRRSLVLHALWERKDDWVGVHDIAARARVSPATASETLSALEKRDWVTVRGSGPSTQRRLTDAKGLLDAWAQHQSTSRPPTVQNYFLPESDLHQLIFRIDRAFDRHHADYAITGEAAAQTYAPYLSNVSRVRCRVLEGPKTEEALSDLDIRRAREGWNLAIMESKTEGEFVFREKEHGAWLASPLQVYLDLLQADGRAREMAEHLRAEKLGV